MKNFFQVVENMARGKTKPVPFQLLKLVDPAGNHGLQNCLQAILEQLRKWP